MTAGVQQNNRLASASYPDPSPMPGGPISVSYSYDDGGNCVSEGVERKYEWDHAGRLRSFRNQATDATEPTQYVQYLYDASGQRVKKLNRKQLGSDWDVVVYIDGVLEQRTQQRGATTKQGAVLHVLDGDKRLGMRRTGETFDAKPDNILVLSDHLGSGNLELDWSLGDFIDREEFRPYGETSFGSYAHKRYRFTGKERDEESGLNYHGARYYAPGLARWMSPDPKGLVDGVNLYGYVRGNPVGYRDPQGTKADAADECIDASSAAGLNRLTEKVLTGSANQSEVSQWQESSNQRHSPQKHASIGVANPNVISERVIAADARDTLATLDAMKSGVVAAGAAEWAQSAGYSIKEQRSVAEIGANIGDMATTHAALLPGVLARSKQEIQTERRQKVVPRDGIIKVGGTHENDAGRGTSLNPGSGTRAQVNPKASTGSPAQFDSSSGASAVSNKENHKSSAVSELRHAIQKTLHIDGTSSERAEYFQKELVGISQKYDWHFSTSTGSDGSYIYSSPRGEAIVIAPDGQMYKGWMVPMESDFQFFGQSFQPNYQRLKPLK